jgi:hypothetical protein
MNNKLLQEQHPHIDYGHNYNPLDLECHTIHVSFLTVPQSDYKLVKLNGAEYDVFKKHWYIEHDQLCYETLCSFYNKDIQAEIMNEDYKTWSLIYNDSVCDGSKLKIPDDGNTQYEMILTMIG